MWTGLHSIGWVTLMQVFLIRANNIFYFIYYPHSGQWKIFQTMDIRWTLVFSRKEMRQKRKLSYSFQLISYNSVVVKNQIYFSPTFLKSEVFISDNIVCVVGGSQCNYTLRDFPLSNSCLDDVVTFKDLLGLVKT